jgi:hypothetical protein
VVQTKLIHLQASKPRTFMFSLQLKFLPSHEPCQENLSKVTSLSSSFLYFSLMFLLFYHITNGMISFYCLIPLNQIRGSPQHNMLSLVPKTYFKNFTWRIFLSCLLVKMLGPK